MKTILFYLSAVGAMILTGCSQQGASPSTAGFTKTQLGGSGEFAIKNAQALAGYESVYVQSVTALPTTSVTDPNASDVAALEFAFEKALKSKIDAVLPIVNAPGEKTLTANAWVTEFSAIPPGSDGIDAADPESLYGNTLISGTSMYVDEISVKVTMSSSSGELLAVFTDSDFGSDIEVAPTGMTNWPRVSEAFGAWCSELADQLGSAASR
ncbi:DUF3313 family protein [Cerasicoccus fimbriatus]|uniref:DUF3313 family protein n=1 Tax=Cerasicoccus fimbriatus TaxID=3014554 RepID=UPI0022B32D80|nr:DUF3313 family protein [Cerasicoccus sp. TK19100]